MRYERTRRWIADAVGVGQQLGEVHPSADPEQIARLTVAALDGLQQQWLTEPAQLTMSAEFSGFVQLLREGGPRSTEPLRSPNVNTGDASSRQDGVGRASAGGAARIPAVSVVAQAIETS